MLNTLKEHRLFEKIDFADIENYLNYFHLEFHSKGKIVHFEGDNCTHLEIIKDGIASIEKIDINGNTKKVNQFSQGDLLGANILFSTYPQYLMTVLAETDLTIIKIKKELFFEIICTQSDTLLSFLNLISDNSLEIGSKIKSDFRVSLRTKILNHISYNIQIQNSRTIQLNTSKTELAKRFGVERTSLSRELQKMKKDGLINYSRNTITLL